MATPQTAPVVVEIVNTTHVHSVADDPAIFTVRVNPSSTLESQSLSSPSQSSAAPEYIVLLLLLQSPAH